MKSKTSTMHFTIDGPWFTWFLRHQWIEENEFKAIQTWMAAFPDLSKRKHLNDLFLKIVNGSAKFEGNSDGPEGFRFEKDNSKYWSPNCGGKEDKQFPLIDSWEDILLRKGGRIFEKELELSYWQKNRTEPDRFSECDNNSLRWQTAAVQNERENPIRTELSKLWSAHRNISNLIGLDSPVPLLPDRSQQLDTLRFAGFDFAGRKSAGELALEYNKSVYDECKAKLEPIKKHLIDKYGIDLFCYSDANLKFYCGVADERLNEMEADRIIAENKKRFTEEFGALSNNVSILTQTGVIPDVETYVKSAMESESRTKIKNEDVLTTKWNSGYISPDGRFFGCAYYEHVRFSEDLVNQLGIDRTNPETKKPYSNAEVLLDAIGWVKVSVSRFFWHQNLTESQKQTIIEYMSAKKLKTTSFNCSNPMTAEEGTRDIL